MAKEHLLYFYTAAGGRNQWSVDAGNLFTQRLAYSTDGGKNSSEIRKILYASYCK